MILRTSLAFLLIFLINTAPLPAQQNDSTAVQDSIFYMDGTILVSQVLDTTLGSIKVKHDIKPGKIIDLDFEDVFCIRYGSTKKHYYHYTQDSASGNIYNRKEMWMFLKGEMDAKAGYKSPGSFYGALATGFVSGLMVKNITLLFTPIAPFAFVSMVGIPKIRIDHRTISDPYALDSDMYILGYERQARTKRRLQAIKGGSIGLLSGIATSLILSKLDKSGKFTIQF